MIHFALPNWQAPSLIDYTSATNSRGAIATSSSHCASKLLHHFDFWCHDAFKNKLCYPVSLFHCTSSKMECLISGKVCRYVGSSSTTCGNQMLTYKVIRPMVIKHYAHCPSVVLINHPRSCINEVLHSKPRSWRYPGISVWGNSNS